MIAIDGPAGAGKSTVARAVAERLGYTFLDSGAMYRCVALAAARANADPNDADAAGALARAVEIDVSDGDILLDGSNVGDLIRTPEISAMTSAISVHPQVREAMVERQRELIDGGRFVAEGRDIGTVVSPDAALKVFLTATDAERARRRALQTGEDPAEVAAAQAERDARDAGRAHSPLRAADDAIELDTTGLDVDAVVDRIVALARERGAA